MVLFDVLDNKVCGNFSKTNQAVLLVAGMMRIHGANYAKDRFVLTEEPDKKGVGKIIAHPQELFAMAIVYT